MLESDSSVELVKEIFKSETVESLCEKHNKAELIALYHKIYGIPPYKSHKKYDIAYNIYNFYLSIVRTEDLARGLHI